MKLSSVPVFLGLASRSMATWHEAKGKDIQYTSVGGYFLQDDPNTNPDGFDYAQHNFGLIDRKYSTDDKFDPDGTKTQWQRFNKWVHYLNHHCDQSENIRYKVIFFGRHGQGYHNVAESFYGTPAWNAKGNGTITWADPLLTPDGFKEAEKANGFYRRLYEQQSMPRFESYYSSPLKRCLQTANTTFGTLDLPTEYPFVPTIKELFREDISIHTCDRRSTKSEIAEFMPGWTFEEGFTEKDELWQGDKGETPAHQVARSKKVLDDVFTNDGSTWISVTSHSGEIAALLTALNHRAFSLSTGQIIPVLIKAELVQPLPASTSAGFTPEATCKQAPVTSLSGKGCVCSSTGSTPSPTL
ncbi:Histidine phosphatase superfamily, clade-1 [Metarhizium rileyi]|uniref:Histidine phosphatase superfamily, clade-1 n=1 Tax=Metarhizium rileyi (strain RCEF 4871) TaxID=1649241 RepID=A0A166VZ05_METRR|nr:Histidine phosphatase superfamily, clade-1 [Metarhizium rileyi RCEF 4871]